MRRKVVYIALPLTAILLFCSILFLEIRSSKMAHAQSFALFSTPTSTPSGNGGGVDWGNPIIIGALIALVGGLATAGVYIYQTHRNTKIEREKLELEREKLETQEVSLSIINAALMFPRRDTDTTHGVTCASKR